MKDDHERGTHVILGIIIILVLGVIFVTFGKTIINNLNAGNYRTTIIDNAANGDYQVSAPDL